MSNKLYENITLVPYLETTNKSSKSETLLFMEAIWNKYTISIFIQNKKKDLKDNRIEYNITDKCKEFVIPAGYTYVVKPLTVSKEPIGAFKLIKGQK